MNKLFTIIRAEVRRTFFEERAYIIQFFTGLITTYIFFIGFFLAYKSLNIESANFAYSLAIGILVWYFGEKAISRMCFYILEECTLGTIEQLYITPIPPVLLLAGRAFGQFCLDLISVILLLTIIVFTTGINISIAPVSTLTVLILTIIGLYGFSYILAGLTIVYKRVTSIADILGYILLFFTGILFPLEKFPTVFKFFAHTLPLTQGIETLRLVLINHLSLLELLTNGQLLRLLINSLAYLIFGLIIFEICDRIARNKGIIGGYV